MGVLVVDRGGSDVTLEQEAEFARVLEHRSPLGSSMLMCNTR